jgi:hypothetical protein
MTDQTAPDQGESMQVALGAGGEVTLADGTTGLSSVTLPRAIPESKRLVHTRFSI